MKEVIPVLNIEKQQAVQWYCSIAERDSRVPASDYGSRFLGFTAKEFSEQLLQVLENMIIDSNSDEVVRRGAHLISSFNLFYGLWADLTRQCLDGTVSQRKGVAKTAVANICNERHAERCREYIRVFMNDPDKEVRSIVSRILRNEFFKTADNVLFINEYVKSSTFADGTYILFHAIAEYKDSLLQFFDVILNACASVVTNSFEKDSTYMNRESYGLSPLLLRLYEQAQNRDAAIAVRCLDAWDLMFEHQIGTARELTQEIGR